MWVRLVRAHREVGLSSIGKMLMRQAGRRADNQLPNLILGEKLTKGYCGAKR